MRKRLKRKEMTKTRKTRVRKSIQGKDLDNFSSGQGSGGMPKCVQEASTQTLEAE